MSETSIKILRPPLLERYYPVVRELRTYLADILESDIRDVLEATQTANSNADVYYELLNTSFVTLKRADAANISPRFKVNPPIMTDMREVSRLSACIRSFTPYLASDYRCIPSQAVEE